MRFIVCFVLLISLSACTLAEDIYPLRASVSETELRQLYLDALRTMARSAELKWRQSPTVPDQGYWGDAVSNSNEGIRAVANITLLNAVLLKHSSVLNESETTEFRRKALSALRYMTASHVTGTGKCTDWKPWGRGWQTAMWAGNMGFAAWILWDDLDAGLRRNVERVVSFEADRYLATKPPTNRWGDTKAEENAWNLVCISLAANMFRHHPHAKLWESKCIEYMMNTVSVPDDATDTTIVDGRPVKDWFAGANYHPDFTLENHGIFHPSYTVVSPATVAEGALLFRYAGRPIPEAADHHIDESWKMLQTIMLPSGEWTFPQGMDWELHSESGIHYLAWLACHRKDPLAAGMERLILQYALEHQKLHGGSFAGPGSPLGFARDAIQAERTSYAYLYHKLLGSCEKPTTIRRETARLSGVHRYEFVDMITQRTVGKFVTFSWKNKIMGQVIPTGPGHDRNPHFSTPIPEGLVGSFELSNPGAKGLKDIQHSFRLTKDGFETEGKLSAAGGWLEQQLRVTSVGEKTLIYQDRITAIQDVEIARELGAPVGIENDEYTGNSRTLYHQGGTTKITGLGTQGLVNIPGQWVNVDARLAVIAVRGSGIACLDSKGYNRNGVCEDRLYASFSDKPRTLKAGESFDRVVVFVTEISPSETAKLATSIRTEGDSLVVPLPEGGMTRVKLVQ